VDGRHMLEPPNLFPHLFDDPGMTVPDRDRDDAGKAVEVLLPGLVPEVLHVAFDDQQRLAIVGDQPWRQVLPAQREHLLTRRTVVRRRCVIRTGKSGRLRRRARYVGRHGDLPDVLHTPYNWTSGS